MVRKLLVTHARHTLHLASEEYLRARKWCIHNEYNVPWCLFGSGGPDVKEGISHQIEQEFFSFFYYNIKIFSLYLTYKHSFNEQSCQDHLNFIFKFHAWSEFYLLEWEYNILF